MLVTYLRGYLGPPLRLRLQRRTLRFVIGITNCLPSKWFLVAGSLPLTSVIVSAPPTIGSSRHGNQFNQPGYTDLQIIRVQGNKCALK